jgi:hypothetical protein
MRLSSVTTTLLFLAIPTLAGAHGGNNDATMIHACVGNLSKIVRIVGVSGSCLSAPPLVAETPAHWPQVQGAGLPGPKGDKGDPGIQGPQGNAGINGLNGRDGAPGTPGTNGTNGTNGIDGRDGATGTRAAGPCFGNQRYIDCGNGTVTDSLSGLIWLQHADCLPDAEYVAANQSAAGLKTGDCGLTDGSSPGDWRLPTGDEWSAMIAKAVVMGCSTANGNAPSLTNDYGLNCLSTGPSSFVGVTADIYSGSSTYEGHLGKVVAALLGPGIVTPFGKGNVLRVWPVRNGTR